jgi:hypothetical protein
MIQNSVAVRDGKNDSFEATVGVTPVLKFFKEAMPANCAAADSGSPIAAGNLPSDWLAASSGGVKSKTASAWTVSGLAAAGLGTNVLHYRMYALDGVTCHEQGSIFPSISLSTSAPTAANSNILNFSATTGISVGMKVSGVGIESNSVVLAVGGTTVTLSKASTIGVGNPVVITFNGDMTLDNINIAQNQVATVASYSKTSGNA